ncbi:MAG: RodZ domain-containing protein, partial [Pseudomonadota bacterium]|nr:RodZ domain-containing protein [Pseudomonadota bacterium]
MELETRDDEVEQDSFRAIGADLGAARLEAGMQLQELAQLVRISRHHLKNLEAGDFDLLPGATYVSGYIRTYSREVGLDPEVMTQRYRALLTDREAKPSYSFPVDRQQPQRSGAMMASIMVIFACLGYGGWYAAGKPDLVAALVGEAPQETVAAPQVETTATEPDNLIIQATEQELADAAPAETSPLTETGEAAIQAVAETAILATQEDGDTAITSATPQTVAPDPATMVTEPGTETEQLAAVASGTQSATGLPATTEEVPGEDTLAAATAPSAGDVDAQTEDVAVAAADTDVPAAAVTADDTASNESAASASEDSLASTGVAYARQRVPELEITVRATSISWIEIIRNDGEEVMAKLMREGEIYVVDSRDRLYLSTGNAGGVELVFHDGAVQSVGESGEILRDLP